MLDEKVSRLLDRVAMEEEAALDANELLLLPQGVQNSLHGRLVRRRFFAEPFEPGWMIRLLAVQLGLVVDKSEVVVFTQGGSANSHDWTDRKVIGESLRQACLGNRQ